MASAQDCDHSSVPGFTIDDSAGASRDKFVQDPLAVGRSRWAPASVAAQGAIGTMNHALALTTHQR
jgi:hypothetical protein